MRRCARPGFPHIDMGIGPIDIQHIGMVHHCLCNIGMQVQTDCNRQVGPDQRPDATQQFPFPILQMITDHRAMQIQIQSIQPRAIGHSQIRQHHFRYPLKCILRYMGGRGRGGPA